jgi:hypothetical protein
MPDVVKNQGRRTVDDSIAWHNNIRVTELEKTALETERWPGSQSQRIQESAPTDVAGMVPTGRKEGMFHQFDQTLENKLRHPSLGEPMPW